ncbi:MAG: DUF2341 domain-containing protein [Candidatus Pacebacteria bacterium]|nr:DUF2341 domain-containing protein [Candidatus Paceibacterota bacterium]
MNFYYLFSIIFLYDKIFLMSKQSFTLIELLVVIAIIGILAGILIISMSNATNSANDVRRKADINQLVKAILIIYDSDGSLPADTANCSLGSDCTGIQAKLTAQGIDSIAKDPNGSFYTYNRISADDFTLSAVMSNNSIYSYSSASSSYGTNALINGCNKRKAITITNSSGSTLTNYQISFDVDYDSDMQADFDDLRFTNSTVSELLPYWIESKTDSSTAKVWVKVPSIPITGTTIYMYYSNSSIASASNGDNTFEFFDGFDGASLDTSKWSGGGSVSSGIINLSGTGITSTAEYGSNIYIETRIKPKCLGSTSANFYDAFFIISKNITGGMAQSAYYFCHEQSGYRNKLFQWNGASSIISPPASAIVNNWNLISVIKKSDRSSWKINSSSYLDHTTAYYASSANIFVNGAIDLDWIRIRKYSSTEPIITIGNEQDS